MNPCYIIGIVGASGSGKTTVARELSVLFETAVLMSQDNYYIGLPDGTDAADWNFDDPSAVDLGHLARDLTALKQGKSVEAPCYHFASHRRAPDPITLYPAPLILVEGLFLFLPDELRRVFDMKIFIDVPPGTCLERRISRDVTERGRSEEEIRRRWNEQAQPMYQRYVEPTRIFADLQLAPEEYGTPARAKQLSDIRKKIAQR